MAASFRQREERAVIFEGFTHLTASGYAHTVLASVGIVVGAEQVIRLRRDRLHRVLGYVYVGSMVLADLAALTVYRFSGRPNVFHVAAVANLFCTAMAIWPMLRRPRPKRWRVLHSIWIGWSYVGLLAAAATEFVIRSGAIETPRAAMIASVIATTAVTGIGAYFIHRPRALPATSR